MLRDVDNNEHRPKQRDRDTCIELARSSFVRLTRCHDLSLTLRLRMLRGDCFPPFFMAQMSRVESNLTRDKPCRPVSMTDLIRFRHTAIYVVTYVIHINMYIKFNRIIEILIFYTFIHNLSLDLSNNS